MTWRPVPRKKSKIFSKLLITRTAHLDQLWCNLQHGRVIYTCIKTHIRLCVAATDIFHFVRLYFTVLLLLFFVFKRHRDLETSSKNTIRVNIQSGLISISRSGDFSRTATSVLVFCSFLFHIFFFFFLFQSFYFQIAIWIPPHYTHSLLHTEIRTENICSRGI